MVCKCCINRRILKNTILDHILASFKSFFCRLEHEFDSSFQCIFFFFQHLCCCKKHCGMEIMSACMCFFSCRTCKFFSAFFRHRKCIHICSQKKNLSPFAECSCYPVATILRLKSVFCQLFHNISFGLWKIQTSFSIFVDVSAVCNCFIL